MLLLDERQRLSLPIFQNARWRTFWAAVFLVSVPVFFQAPLVRYAPSISLLATLGWLMLSLWLWNRPRQQLWGDLLFGFTLSWWAGSLYWGWLRTEPLLHLPVEALPVPIALLALAFGHFRIGSLFFLGSFLGTCITDFYCMAAGLMPWWERMMNAEGSNIQLAQVLPAALAQMHTLPGMILAAGVSLVLLAITVRAMQSEKLHWWAFAGAVFSTLLVDGLFWATANLFLVGS
ncbi:DUF3120 domain-containing protein [Gloeobacter kilaueensis]|uniref:DUF3120 domain-containing protein n=1 Tax=Gloeobacter kilaueensis TaxID=1416614 RepID=UPI00059B94CB|nr:DUF3120 domain-containing protein [Gloeobacter kilaueensis]